MAHPSKRWVHKARVSATVLSMGRSSGRSALRFARAPSGPNSESATRTRVSPGGRWRTAPTSLPVASGVAPSSSSPSDQVLAERMPVSKTATNQIGKYPPKESSLVITPVTSPASTSTVIAAPRFWP